MRGRGRRPATAFNTSGFARDGVSNFDICLTHYFLLVCKVQQYISLFEICFLSKTVTSINSTILRDDDVVQEHIVVRMLLVVSRYCLVHEQVRYTFKVECD